MTRFSRILLRPLAAFALPLGLASCAAVEAPARAEAQQVPPGPALWKVADEDTTIYLFGTVHVLPSDLEWFQGPVRQAFGASEELVTEVEVGDAAGMQQALLSTALLPEGQNLRELMSEENRAQFEEALVAMGLPVQALDRFEPWYAAMTLALLPLTKAGYGAESGVERVLTTDAGDKEREALETLEEQVALFDGLPLDAQLTFLDETVESISRLDTMIAEMVDSWMRGDADELARLLNSEMSDPALRERLLTRRNANWAEWIDQRLDRPGTVFVAVGAGHLAGQDSVQDQLAERGITTARVLQ